jgi:carbon-monoxide dehydrogenase large subunit
MDEPVASVEAGRFVGQAVARREDPRLLVGRGRFVDDITLPGLLHVAFLRSDIARGTITHLDLAPAARAPGVRGVFAGADLNPEVGAMWATVSGPPPTTAYPPLLPLAGGDVRFVGDPIALVVADSRARAEDACEAIEVDIDPMPAVIGMDAAAADGAPLVHPELGTNLASSIEPVSVGDIDAIFANAAHVVTGSYSMAKVAHLPMETRGLVVDWNPHGPEMRIWASTQNPHEVRAYCARALDLPENVIHVVSHDVGGGFGLKVFVGREETAVMLAARRIGAPVKWIEDRRENLIAANHARGDRASVRLALDADGQMLGLDVVHEEDVGAYPKGGVASVAGLVKMMFTGPYRIPAIRFASRAHYTNTCGRTAYRGPWLMESFAREQIVDRAARQLGIDPLDLRRRNIIQTTDLPYQPPNAIAYDVLSAAETLEQAATMVDYAGWRRRQEVARAQGRIVGIGISAYVEPSGGSRGVLSTDQATIRIEPSGAVNVFMGTGSSGNSVETTMAQVVAEHLGCELDDVVLHQGDTDAAPFGSGTAGSRTAPIAAAAARQSAIDMRERLVSIAAHVLEASEHDLEVRASRVSVRGTPNHGITFREIAQLAYLDADALPPDVPLGLETTARFRPGQRFTWSNACHICTCEIDPQTGMVSIDRYVVSEDCGVMINPKVVDGQVAGGVAQGISQALYEDMRYDEDGNPLTTTFLDYGIPTSAEVPTIEIGHIETPSAIPGGFKGMGEGGAIGSPGAVANAVADALAPRAEAITHVPIAPADVLAALHAHESAS